MPNNLQRLLSAPDRKLWIKEYIARKRRNLTRKPAPKLGRDAARKYTLRQWDGLNLLLDQTSIVDLHVFRFGAWEAPQTAIMDSATSEMARHDSVTFLDIGSFWALYAMRALKHGASEVHAFEPDRRNFAQLQAQLFLNDLTSRITVHPLAISDHDGTVSFEISESFQDGNRGMARVTEPLGATAATGLTQVNCRRLDGLFAWTDRTIIMKLDVEGHEASALNGMKSLIANNRVFLQVEIFEANLAQTMAIAGTLGLRSVHSVDVDHYLTNMPAEMLGWLDRFQST